MRKSLKRGIAMLAVAAMLMSDGQMVRAAEAVVTETTQVEEKGKITGFVALPAKVSYITAKDEQEVLTCVENFPKTLSVYIDGKKEPSAVDVTWEQTNTYGTDKQTNFYEFSPVWDETEYALSEELNPGSAVPLITVTTLVEDKKQEATDDPEYGRVNGTTSKASNKSAKASGDEQLEEEDADQAEVLLGSLAESTYVHNTRYLNCDVIDGIDVSKYQGYIDWNQVKDSGVEFAIIRVGYRGLTSGSLSEDDYYQINIQRALAAGLKVGVYIFSQATTEAEAVEEANYILSRISSYNITLPVVIDYEYGANNSGRLYNANLSVEQATNICNSFCARVAEAGYTPMVYANKTMLTNHLNASAISDKYKIWLANYTTQTSYTGDYTFWQYSSSGRVNGVGGDVDCNFWYRPKSESYTNIIPDGEYIISSAVDNNMVLNVKDASTVNGGNIALATKNGSDAQKFNVKYMGNGKYAISPKCSGLMMDVANGSKDVGANVQQYQDNGYDVQRWYIGDAGNGYYYVESCWNGLYLYASGGIADAGTNIILWNHNGQNAQKFKFAKSGMHVGDDGNWYYYKDGSIDRNYTGMAQNAYGWWYIKNGVLDLTYTGVASNEYGYWYMRNGVLDSTYTGMAHDNQTWYYMTNGTVNRNYTGMACNEYGWWYIKNGVLDLTYTGMACNDYGWWYMTNGALDWNYTGVANNEYGYWYMKNGALDLTYTGMACDARTWYYMTGGALNQNYTGMACNDYGWWYVKNGVLDLTYTGMASNDYGWWYMTNGALDMTYTGSASNEYGDWYFVNGVIQL